MVAIVYLPPDKLEVDFIPHIVYIYAVWVQ